MEATPRSIEIQCTDCGSDMTEGVVLDYRHTRILPSKWQSKEAESEDLFFGFKNLSHKG